VIDHGDQLREAFETHENLAPDPAAVYARVQELARTYRRRRRGAQAAGGAVLSAGLIAGVINLPGLLPGRPNDSVTMVAPAAAPTSSTPPSDAELQKDWDAYFAAGYGYADALQLAQIWNSTDDVGTVKAEAGRRLLAGETLPIQPGPEDDPSSAAVDPQEKSELTAYFAAGYDYNNAVQLAKLWKIADPYQAKVEAGKKLLASETLPVRPSPQNVQAAKEGAQVNAFFAAGYDYNDALQLAKLWKTADAYHAKVEAGKKLLAGETLPIRP
jgi:hypothetical protein